MYLDGSSMLSYLINENKELYYESNKEYFVNYQLINEYELYLSSIVTSGNELVLFVIEPCNGEEKTFEYKYTKDYFHSFYKQEGICWKINNLHINGELAVDSNIQCRIGNGLLNKDYIMDEYFYSTFESANLISKADKNWKYDTIYFSRKDTSIIKEISFDLSYCNPKINTNLDVKIYFGEQNTDIRILDETNKINCFTITNLEAVKQNGKWELVLTYMSGMENIVIYPFLKKYVNKTYDGKRYFPEPKTGTEETIKKIIICSIDESEKKNLPNFLEISILAIRKGDRKSKKANLLL